MITTIQKAHIFNVNFWSLITQKEVVFDFLFIADMK